MKRLYLTLIKSIIIPPFLTRWSYHISSTNIVLLFFTRHWPFFYFSNWPCRLWFMSKKLLKQNINFCKLQFLAKIGSTLHLQYIWSSKKRLQEGEYFKWSPITWESNDKIKLYYPIRLCSSTGHLYPSKITSYTSIVQTITRHDTKSFVQSFAFLK